MKTFNDPSKLQKWSDKIRIEGKKIALVPTMGHCMRGIFR